MPTEKSLQRLLEAGQTRWVGQSLRNPSEPGFAAESPADTLFGGSPGAAKAGFRWSLSALRGQIVEVLGHGLTASARLLLEAQQKAEPAVWISAGPSTFFAPDLARQGIDLEALPVVRAPDQKAAWTAADELLRSGSFGLCILDEVDAAAALPRSTLTTPNDTRRWSSSRSIGPNRNPSRRSTGHSRSSKAGLANTSLAVQVRLANLARRHQSVLLWLRSPTAMQRDPLVQAGLRVHARCDEAPGSADRSPKDDWQTELHPLFECRLDLLKSKGRRAGSECRFLAESVPGAG
ncbi:MAG: hypothetical protein AAF196_08835 [Planctomycetota bacterium]